MTCPRISTVAPGSAADSAGIRPGDRLISINGHPIRDLLDYIYHSDVPSLSLQLCRKKKRFSVRLHNPSLTPVGISFHSYLLDKTRSCANRCVFCFVEQLPPRLRKPLYFKDDDVRLSFLMGNYVSLTNVSQTELARLVALRVSRLNISVHTTNPLLRCQMMRNDNAGNIFRQLRYLARHNVELHCQIVCIPGINDAAELDRTMRDLARLYPAIASVSVVPVGLTQFRKQLPYLPPYDSSSAAQLIAQVDAFGSYCFRRTGSRIFYCADEFFIKAGLDLPLAPYYQDFPQFQNGVGMLRALVDEFRDALKNTPATIVKSSFSIATGHAAFNTLRLLLSEFAVYYGEVGNIFAVDNLFFGLSVDVAGLITGHDLIAALKNKNLGSRLLLSANMLRHSGDMFLDDFSPAQLEQELGVVIQFVGNSGEQLLHAMLGTPYSHFRNLNPVSAFSEGAYNV